MGPAARSHDDLYLVHRDSVVSPDAMSRYFDRVSELVRQAPDSGRYLADLRGCSARPLTRAELGRVIASEAILMGFRVPERSVSTNWIADRFIEALDGQPGIEQAMGTTVAGVTPANGTRGDAWTVRTRAGPLGPFDCVVNALWEGRLAVDRNLGLSPPASWTHRYRLSLFVRTDKAIRIPSVVIATGPFGDIKNYTDRDFYFSAFACGLAPFSGFPGRRAKP